MPQADAVRVSMRAGALGYMQCCGGCRMRRLSGVRGRVWGEGRGCVARGEGAWRHLQVTSKVDSYQRMVKRDSAISRTPCGWGASGCGHEVLQEGPELLLCCDACLCTECCGLWGVRGWLCRRLLAGVRVSICLLLVQVGSQQAPPARIHS